MQKTGSPPLGEPKKRHPKPWLLVLLLFWTCIVEGAYAQQQSHRSWSLNEGLPTSMVNATAQTPDGFVWIGTYSGLIRFDGEEFVRLSRDANGNPLNPRVTALITDRKGQLWVGEEYGGLLKLEKGKLHWVRQAGTAPLMAITESAEGEIWALDRDGNLHEAKTGKRLRAEGEPARTCVLTQAAQCQTTRRTYILHHGSLYALEKGELRHLKEVKSVQAIGPAREEGIWVLAQNTLYKLGPDGKLQKRQIFPPLQSGVTALCEGADGVYVGTANDGLVRLNLEEGSGERIQSKSIPADTWVRHLALDMDKNLWIATSLDGVLCLHETNSRIMQPPPPWDRRAMKTVCPNKEGGYLVGTEGAGLLHYDKGRWQKIGKDGELINEYIWSVIQTKTGDLWVGTWGGGVYRYRNKAFERVPGLMDNAESVACLYEAKDGTLWIGTMHGLYSHSQEGRTIHYPDTVSQQIHTLAEEASGAIWAAGANGYLCRIQDSAITYPVAQKLLQGRHFTSLLVDSEQALWIGCQDEGLLLWDKRRLHDFGNNPMIAAEGVSFIEERKGILWVGAGSGIHQLSTEKLKAVARGGPVEDAALHLIAEPKTIRGGRAQGAQPACHIDGEGRLWIPTTNGLLCLTPPAHQSRPNLRPRIDQVLVNGSKLWMEETMKEGRLELPAGVKALELHFTNPCFRDDENISFRYRLNREQWCTTTTRSASYGDLAPGNHLFEVEAKQGLWSAQTKLSLSIAPYLWQRKWIQALGVLTIIGLISGALHLREKQVHRQKTARLMQEQAIERERTRIAQDIHDDLGSNLTKISLLSQPIERPITEPSRVFERLKKINTTAVELAKRMDEIVWAISPRHDNVESLIQYACGFAQEQLASAGIACRLKLPPAPLLMTINPEARHHVFLAIQEAVNNIVKHSGGKEAVLEVRQSEQTLIIVIEDNGVGLPLLAKKDFRGGNGLKNMEKRMQESKGSCVVENLSPRGTRVKLTLTCKGNA